MSRTPPLTFSGRNTVNDIPTTSMAGSGPSHAGDPKGNPQQERHPDRQPPTSRRELTRYVPLLNCCFPVDRQVGPGQVRDHRDLPRSNAPERDHRQPEGRTGECCCPRTILGRP